jgi:uncharacterized protein (TIGR02466 family)
MLKIDPIFAIPFGSHNINRQITEAELEFVNNQPRRDNLGNWTSVDSQVLKTPPMKDISNFIHSAIYDYFKEVFNPRDKIIPYITLSWFNYSDKDEYHHPHNHSNSLVSGVFYMQTSSEDTFTILKEAHRPTILITGDGEPNQWNVGSIDFKVNSGNLILFPSHMYHRVDKIQHDNGTRISIAFNVFIKGIIGSTDSLNELIL